MQTVESNVSIETIPSLPSWSKQSACADGVCAIDTGFAAMLPNSRAKLVVVPTEEALDFNFNSPAMS